MIIICGHCRQRAIGHASVGKVRVCHPDSGMDCYRLVTVYRHWMPCRPCSEANLLLRAEDFIATPLLNEEETAP